MQNPFFRTKFKEDMIKKGSLNVKNINNKCNCHSVICFTSPWPLGTICLHLTTGQHSFSDQLRCSNNSLDFIWKFLPQSNNRPIFNGYMQKLHFYGPKACLIAHLSKYGNLFYLYGSEVQCFSTLYSPPCPNMLFKFI